MEDEDNFKCNLCNNTYKYEGTLKTHIMVKHCKSNSYNCDQCEYHPSSIDFGVKTQTPKDASVGIKPDKEKGPEELKVGCSQSDYRQVSILTKDLRNEIPFSCKQCDNSFKSSWHLKRHLLAHSEKPLICNQCDFSSKKSGNLRRHLLYVHNQKKPFLCNQCEYSCNKAGYLKQHLLVHP